MIARILTIISAPPASLMPRGGLNGYLFSMTRDTAKEIAGQSRLVQDL
jgi:hypothetical protein